MFDIQENRFYSRADLAELLSPHGVDVDHFISRLAARKVLRPLWRGSDLLAAWDRATPLAEQGARPAPQITTLKPKGRPRKPSHGPACKRVQSTPALPRADVIPVDPAGDSAHN